MLRPTERFSNRVENYIRYRPSYPAAFLEALSSTSWLKPDATIADIGSGTGILTELFLREGYRVYAVEPNREMRAAAERLLQHYPHFASIDGTAEATGLASGSVDLVTAGQAFHWFEQEKAKLEFRRILKEQGWIMLIWNERREDSSPFAVAYEHVLQTYATDYNEVNHKHIDEAVLGRFFEQGYTLSSFENSQLFDYDALKGRLLSSSYAPEADQPGHMPMLAELQHIFDVHQQDGYVSFEYDTKMYCGQL